MDDDSSRELFGLICGLNDAMKHMLLGDEDRARELHARVNNRLREILEGRQDARLGQTVSIRKPKPSFSTEEIHEIATGIRDAVGDGFRL